MCKYSITTEYIDEIQVKYFLNLEMNGTSMMFNWNFRSGRLELLYKLKIYAK